MSKLLFLVSYLPFIGFAQDVRNYSSCDVIVNQLIENTVSFIKYKNTPKTNFRFYLTAQGSSINWDQEGLSKWKISEQNAKISNKKILLTKEDL